MGLFHWLRMTLAGGRGQPPDQQFRVYEVAVFDEPIGAFALPVGDHMTDPRSPSRPLLTRPFRADFLDDFFYYWVEPTPDGTFRTIIWPPDTPEHRAEAERFFHAAHGRFADGSLDPARPPQVAPRSAEETHLIRAILSDRDAEQPYLDYAARLRAKGDTYGEYIRLTLEIEKRPELDAHRAGLEARRAGLVQTDGPRWVLPLADLGLYPGGDIYNPAGYTPDIWYGENGVIEELDLGPDTHVFPTHMPRLFHSAPFLRKLAIRSRDATVADIGTTPEWSQIESLDLALADGTADDFRRFAESPYLGGLRDLNLSGYRFGPGAAAHLARATWLTGVRNIDLSGNAMGDDGAEALAASPFLANLTTAELSDNDFTDRALIALCSSSHLAHLTVLHVAGGVYSETGLRAAAAAVFVGALTSINLNDSGLNEAAARALAGGRFPALKSLVVAAGTFGADGWSALLSAQWFGKLERLVANNCGLGDDGARILSAAGFVSLRELDFGGNQIGDVGVAALVRSEAVSGLCKLSLWNNPFGPTAVKVLAETDLPLLEELDLSRVNLGRAGAQMLAASPFLKKLKRLVVSEEFVGIVGRATLVERFTERVVWFA